MPSHFPSQNVVLPLGTKNTCAQIRDWHSYGHRPSSKLGKPFSVVFESKYIQ